MTKTGHNKTPERNKESQFYKINKNEYHALSTTKREVFGAYQLCSYDTHETI